MNHTTENASQRPSAPIEDRIRLVVGIVLMVALFSTVPGEPTWAMGYEERTDFSAAGVTELDVYGGIFDVGIAEHQGNQVRGQGIDIPRGFTVETSRRKGSYQVYVRGRESLFGSIAGRPQLRIQVPSGTNVNVETVSGGIHVDGVRGSVSAESESGGIRLEDLTGKMEVDGTSGAVSVRSCSGELLVETVSGSATIRRFRGSVNLSTVSGAIQTEGLQLTGPGRFESISGTVDVSLDHELFDLRADLRSTTGRIRVNGADRGTSYLSEGRVILSVKTTSGGISVHAGR